jgi:CheY-like chemotaxis protein
VVRISHKALLECKGMGVVAAENPKAALEYLDTAEVDVLVTDHNMPCMTGIDLIRCARIARPNLAAVLVTGHVASDLSKESAELGVVMVRKEESFRHLISAVQSLAPILSA